MPLNHADEDVVNYFSSWPVVSGGSSSFSSASTLCGRSHKRLSPKKVSLMQTAPKKVLKVVVEKDWHVPFRKKICGCVPLGTQPDSQILLETILIVQLVVWVKTPHGVLICPWTHLLKLLWIQFTWYFTILKVLSVSNFPRFQWSCLTGFGTVLSIKSAPINVKCLLPNPFSFYVGGMTSLPWGTQRATF